MHDIRHMLRLSQLIVSIPAGPLLSSRLDRFFEKARFYSGPEANGPVWLAEYPQWMCSHVNPEPGWSWLDDTFFISHNGLEFHQLEHTERRDCHFQTYLNKSVVFEKIQSGLLMTRTPGFIAMGIRWERSRPCLLYTSSNAPDAILTEVPLNPAESLLKGVFMMASGASLPTPPPALRKWWEEGDGGLCPIRDDLEPWTVAREGREDPKTSGGFLRKLAAASNRLLRYFFRID